MAALVAEVSDDVPVHAATILRTLSDELDGDAIVVSSVGNNNVWASAIMPIRNRASFIQEGMWGTMGGELAGGIAAKLVHPDRQVVVILGDGSMLMSGSDLATAVDERTNLLVVVFNDGRYGMIETVQRIRFQRTCGTTLPLVNFSRWAESFGVPGIRVEKTVDLRQAVAHSLKMVSTTPVLLEVVCGYGDGWPDLNAMVSGET
jgi:acetolactate synthase-1/2/3 large subunit